MRYVSLMAHYVYQAQSEGVGEVEPLVVGAGAALIL